MITRTVVALVALPFILLPIWFGGVWFAVLALVIALAGGYEFYTLLATGGYHPALPIGLVWLAALTLTGLQPGMPLLLPVLAAGFMITYVYVFFQQEEPIGIWLATCIGALYLGVMIGQMVALRYLPHGFWWLVLGLLLTWSNDAAAYFVGVTLGRSKLWPRLSPKKTWEGTIGGWLCAALFGAGGAYFLPFLPITIWQGALLGLLGGVLGLLGDLAISVLKRQVGVKDSGRLFPGHGGMLDRLDSALFLLPFVYQVAFWLTQRAG
ncbi:MAG: phosphatidate cytidylyltransferase [Caldilineaceae bacterium]|nr:phosphatidate cytidylyltransferase [Caldilineaceae bacterium]